MGVYIKGIDLPNSGQIELIIRPHGKVWIETKGIGRAEALQIPTPHGRLIDADALFQDLREHNIPFNNDINSAINVAPTILEAEE